MSTPNMNINTPVVGTTTGPQYATDLNNCFLTVDAHDHSTGNGVPITPAGLNISSDLSFLNNDATNLRSTRFQIQSSALADASDLNCLYVTGVDLYYNDGNGNQIQLTQSGSIAGTSGSISGLSSPASATYVSGSQTFVWQSDALTPANMDAGSVIFRNISASSYGITVSPPTLTSNYNLTLPALPVSQKIMTLDNTGAISAPYSIDNSTLEISSNVIQIKDSGVTTAKINNSAVTTAKINDSAVTTAKINDSAVTTAKINDGAVTQAKLASKTIAYNTYLGVFSTTSTTFQTVVSVSINTTGRPVRVEIGGSYISSQNAYYRITRDPSTVLVTSYLGGSSPISVPPSSLAILDVSLAAGSYQYNLECKSVDGSTYASADTVTIFAYEL